MDFSFFYQLRTKKIWWVDVVFYFVISLLISTILCYLIFILKVYLQGQEIKNLDAAIETVGTDLQKDHEKTVFNYQKKINDYALLIANHQFSSNIFAFLEKNTLPNVWFSKFSISIKQKQVDLSGQADTLDGLSRQTVAFEKNEFVKKVSLLGSNIGAAGKIDFNLALILDPKIFNYIPQPLPENPTIPENNNAPVEPGAEVKSAEKLIVSFSLPLSPEVVGAIDQTNRTITLNVPGGINLTNLEPSIIVSQKAAVLPAPNAIQDFTNPAVYTVTAEDGSSQNYTVTVSAAVPANTQSRPSKAQAAIITIIVLGVLIAVGLGIFLFLKKRSNNKKVTKVIQ
ncbi:MAG: DUF5018 domain-containing protein [Patescibacteria group bacterium]